MGHEGEGSAAFYLKQRCLIQSLDTGVREEVRRGTGFILWHCKMQLTEKGLENIPEIISIVYESIEVQGPLCDSYLVFVVCILYCLLLLPHKMNWLKLLPSYVPFSFFLVTRSHACLKVCTSSILSSTQDQGTV